MPVLDRDAEVRHREPAAALRARRRSRPAGLILNERLHPFRIGALSCVVIAERDNGNCNVLLIRAGSNTVLIDTGFGDERVLFQPLLRERLGQAGAPPEAIDTVVLTHADLDHIGGAVHEGTIAFPNARHILLRAEFDFWAKGPERLKSRPEYDEDFRDRGNTIPPKRLGQLDGRLELVEDGAEPIPGIRLIHAPGHTPGYALIELSSDGERAYAIGDFVYNGADIANPAWFSHYDDDPALATASRRALFAKAYEENALLLAYHVPFPGLGRVSPLGEGWLWEPVVTSSA